MPSTIAFQWMQVIAGTSHVMRRTGMLQVSQYATDAFDMVSVQPAGVITLEQRSQALVGEFHVDHCDAASHSVKRKPDSET